MTVSHTQLVEWDRAHVIHPWSYVGPTLLIARGKGTRYWDVDGREYLDGLGGIQLCQVGHGRADIAAVAARQMERLEYAPLFWNLSNEPAVMLGQRLAELAPAGIEQAFFTLGGSDSCESAIKFARLYHHLRGERERTIILSLGHSYHGMTYGTLSATGLEGLKTGFGDLPGGFIHLTTPYPYHEELFGDADVMEFCLRELEETIERVGAHRIAAFIGEPVLTVGGVIVPPEGDRPAVSEMCHRHGILVIADEVVTAFGRLGSWFASERHGLRADLIATAKGITSGYVPLGAVLMSDEVGDTLKNDERGFMHGCTLSGHPVACAVALENLDIIEREDLLANSMEAGAYLAQGLETLLELPVVGEVRGSGLLASVELVSDKVTRSPLGIRRQEIADRVRDEEGVILRTILQNVIIAPCLTLARGEADWIVEALRRVLGTTSPDGRPFTRPDTVR